MTTSRIPGFYNLTLEERRAQLASAGGLTAEELAALDGEAGLSSSQAEAT